MGFILMFAPNHYQISMQMSTLEPWNTQASKCSLTSPRLVFYETLSPFQKLLLYRGPVDNSLIQALAIQRALLPLHGKHLLQRLNNFSQQILTELQTAVTRVPDEQ